MYLEAAAQGLEEKEVRETMSELLSCPFCGGEAEMLTAESMYGGYLFGIMCNDCRSRGDVYDTEAEAIAAWNTRVDYHGYEQAAIEAWESIKAWNSRAERTCYADEVTHRDCKYSVNRGWKERTCKQEERGWGTEGDHARVWLTCGHDCMVPTVQDLPNYCPNCGAKVVGE